MTPRARQHLSRPTQAVLDALRREGRPVNYYRLAYLARVPVPEAVTALCRLDALGLAQPSHEQGRWELAP